MSEVKFKLTPIDEIETLIKQGKITSGKITKNEYNGSRVPFERHFDDGTKGPLLIQSPDCFSYGVNENTSKQGELTGYNMCVVLQDSKGPTEEQLKYTKLWKELYKLGCAMVVKNKIELKMPTLNKDTVAGKVKDPVYYSYLEATDENGDPILDSSKPPRLYIKLETSWQPVNMVETTNEDGEIVLVEEKVDTAIKTFTKTVKNKQTGKDEVQETRKKMVINTDFWDTDGNDIRFSELKGRNCNVFGVISIDGLYVSGNGISFQIKLSQAQIRPHASRGAVKLLQRPKPSINKRSEDTEDTNDTHNEGVTIVIKSDENDISDSKPPKEQSDDALLDEN